MMESFRRSKELAPIVVNKANDRRNKGRLAAQAVNLIPDLAGTYGDRWSNCWGMTLFLLGGQSALRFVENEDLDPWLEIHCVRVKRPRFGDVLAIRYGPEQHCDCGCGDEEGALEHTAIYVGDGLYLHQAGAGGPILIETFKQVRDTYSGDRIEYMRKVA